MGTISQVHTYPNGLTIGFDSELNDWVPVDKQAFEGSTLGNIARGANRSGEMIVQGIKELAVRDPTDQAAIQAQTEALARRQQAASAAAPVAEAIGGAVPDVAAGVGLGLATSGLGLPAMVGAEAGLGAVLGGIRPGTVEERIQSAVISSGLAVLGLGVGAALGPVAVKGIGGAVTAFRGLEGKMLGRINQAVETAGAQMRQADEAATMPGGRSVGAAETPAGEVDAGVALENRALQATDQAGADLMEQPRMEQMAARAQELDMPVPIGFGSRAMSPARILQQANEYQPFGGTVNKSIMNRQEAKVSEYMSDALGIKPKAALFVDDLADAETEIGNKFNLVRDRMPNVDGEAIARALEGGGPGKAGAFGSFKATKQINDAVENARGRPIFDGEEFMNTRKRLAAKMAKAYKFGEEEDGDVFMSALNRLDDLLRKHLKQQGKDKLAETWQTARTQWRVYAMTKAPGGIDPGTGRISPRSLFNRMSKNPSSGGWGRGRPEKGTPARKLYDALEIAVASESGVPKTGALPPLIQGIMRGPAGQALAGGAAGYGLWDALRN